LMAIGFASLGLFRAAKAKSLTQKLLAVMGAA
jgi:hypothetical protein